MDYTTAEVWGIVKNDADLHAWYSELRGPNDEMAHIDALDEIGQHARVFNS
jgi:hypothetical protein